MFSWGHRSGEGCHRAQMPQGLCRQDLQAQTSALRRSHFQPAPTFLIPQHQSATWSRH